MWNLLFFPQAGALCSSGPPGGPGPGPSGYPSGFSLSPKQHTHTLVCLLRSPPLRISSPATKLAAGNTFWRERCPLGREEGAPLSPQNPRIYSAVIRAPRTTFLFGLVLFCLCGNRDFAKSSNTPPHSQPLSHLFSARRGLEEAEKLIFTSV